MDSSFLQTTKFVLDILQPLVTIIALAAGLWWFIIRRAAVKKLNIAHSVDFVRLSQDVYVGVTVTLTNIGNRKIKNISPAGDNSGVVIEELAPYLGTNRSYQEDSPEYELGFLGGRYFPEIIELEPGEEQHVLFDFLIPKSTKALKVYSFVDNARNKGLGWNRTTIHEVTL